MARYYRSPITTKIEQMVEQLKAVGKIRDIINIRNFIKLPGEKVKDLSGNLIKHVVELYIRPNRDTEIDGEVVKQP